MAQGSAKGVTAANPGWQDFTPSWTALTVGNGTETARYMQIGTTVFIHYELLFGSSTAITGNAFFVLPVEPSDGYSDGTVHNFGTVRYTDATSSDFNGSTILGSGDQVIMKVWSVSGSQIVSINLSSTVPFTWTTSDAIGFHFMYEAATSAGIILGRNNDHGGLSGLTDDDHSAYVAKAQIGSLLNNSADWAYTNTAYVDLDATTGAQGDANSVSVTTGTSALVSISAELENNTGSAYTILAFRISGATTVATDANRTCLQQQGTVSRAMSMSRVTVVTGLTPGVNVFELTTRVTAGTGLMKNTELIVIPL